MKRYISSASKATSSDLVDALCAVIYNTLDMGDYLEDVVETYAQLGDIELPDDYDADVMLIKVLTELVNQHSEIIPEGIIYNFTEYSDMLLDEIAMSRPSGKQSNLYKSINTIYSQIGEFPGGDSVKQAIEENIFSSPLVEGIAGEIGYAIAQIYWRYIDRPEYGVRTNNAGATGVSNGCRSPKVINGKYKFAFMQDISSYYYDDLMTKNPDMPAFTGYMVKFYDKGSDVYADFFNLFVVSSTGGVANWDIGTKVLHTIKVNGFDDAAIESAAHEIADWYNDHVDEAIDAALDYAGGRPRMKRYIKSNSMGATPDEFHKYLKLYLGDELSDQDIEDMVNDAFPKNRKPEVLLPPELETQIYSEFPRKQADEICSLIECGYSVDNAIQTVLETNTRYRRK